jgi:hypothetical protein
LWGSEWVALTVAQRGIEWAKRMVAVKACSRAVRKESEWVECWAVCSARQRVVSTAGGKEPLTAVHSAASKAVSMD